MFPGDHALKCKIDLTQNVVTMWLQVIYKSLLGKALPYLSSQVTIAAPTRSMLPSRYISLVTPKANSSPHLAAFRSSSLLPVTGTNCKNH